MIGDIDKSLYGHAAFGFIDRVDYTRAYLQFEDGRKVRLHCFCRHGARDAGGPTRSRSAVGFAGSCASVVSRSRSFAGKYFGILIFVLVLIIFVF